MNGLIEEKLITDNIYILNSLLAIKLSGKQITMKYAETHRCDERQVRVIIERLERDR